MSTAATDCFDDEQAGFLLARHLLECGHPRIGFLHEPQRSESYVSPGMLLRDGINRALRTAEAAGEQVAALEHLELPENDLASARAFAAGFAAREQRPGAVICHHDLLAAGFLAGLRTAGAAVPGQIAVAGFDDGPLAEGLGLTTVRQAFAESGRHAAELLRSLIRSPGHAVARTLLTPELVLRETTVEG